MAKKLRVTPAQKRSWSKVHIDKGPRTLQLVDAKKAVRKGETFDDRVDLTFAEADDLEGPVVTVTVYFHSRDQKKGGLAHFGRTCDALQMLGAGDEEGDMPTSVDDFAGAIGRKVKATILHVKDDSGATTSEIEHGSMKSIDDE